MIFVNFELDQDIKRNLWYSAVSNRNTWKQGVRAVVI